MFLLDLTSKVPIFEQIRDQVRRFIRAGVLRPGDRLPSVRQLAQENGINPNTVARAYAELERAGFVYNLPKKGVYVAGGEPGETKDAREARILRALAPLKESGVTAEELRRAVADLYEEEM